MKSKHWTPSKQWIHFLRSERCPPTSIMRKFIWPSSNSVSVIPVVRKRACNMSWLSGSHPGSNIRSSELKKLHESQHKGYLEGWLSQSSLIQVIVKSELMALGNSPLDSFVSPHIVHCIPNFNVGKCFLNTNISFQVIYKTCQRLKAQCMLAFTFN